MLRTPPNDSLYHWQSTTTPYPFVTVTAFSWRGSGEVGKRILRDRRELRQRVQEQWGIDETTSTRSSWAAAQWRDYYDWERILGASQPTFEPNLLVELGYREDSFFCEAFRFHRLGISTKTSAIVIGDFCQSIFGKLPPPGEMVGGVLIRDPHDGANQILWLGFILQASRMVLG
jgi:hypothetical protein